MLRIASKNQTRQRVHDRIRKKVMGTPERPRLNVYRSLNHIYVQLIDDLKGVTLALPDGVKPEGIEASFVNGVLEVKIPKPGAA